MISHCVTKKVLFGLDILIFSLIIEKIFGVKYLKTC